MPNKKNCANKSGVYSAPGCGDGTPSVMLHARFVNPEVRSTGRSSNAMSAPALQLCRGCALAIELLRKQQGYEVTQRHIPKVKVAAGGRGR